MPFVITSHHNFLDIICIYSEGVCRITFFMFTYQNLQCGLERFAVKCEVTGMRSSTSKLEAMTAKLSVYRLVQVSTLTYSYERWDQDQKDKIMVPTISFLCGVSGCFLIDLVRSSVTLRVTGLLLHTEISQWRWFCGSSYAPP